MLRVSGSIRRQFVERWEEAMSCCCNAGSAAKTEGRKELVEVDVPIAVVGI